MTCIEHRHPRHSVEAEKLFHLLWRVVGAPQDQPNVMACVIWPPSQHWRSLNRENDSTQAGSRKPSPPWWRVALIGRDPRVTFIRLTITVVLIILIRQFALIPVRVKGISMLPTYKDGRFSLVNRLVFVFHSPRRGDIVAVRLRAGENVMLMKRIVGLPGETVEFRDGELYVDGQLIPEPYLKLPSDWNEPPKLVGTNEYYIVGDNRSMPPVYHEHGCAERWQIVGKPL